MQKIVPFILVVSLILAGCNLPTNAEALPTPTTDLVATEVSALLTAQPTQQPTLPPQPTLTPMTVPTMTLEPATPTVTAQPSPTTVAGDPAVTYGQPTWTDALDNAKNFYLYENDNTKVEEETGSLALVGRNANGWLGWSLTYAQQPANFYGEMTFITRDCASNDLYGMVFRANKENAGYFYGMTCDGKISLYTRDFNNNTNAELLSAQSAPSALTGSNQTNRLGVQATGSKLSLYVNGVLAAEVNDSTYASGYLGAFIAANQTAGFRVDLDTVKLWKQ